MRSVWVALFVCCLVAPMSVMAERSKESSSAEIIFKLEECIIRKGETHLLSLIGRGAGGQ